MLLLACTRVEKEVRVLFAVLTDQHEIVAFGMRTVFKVARLALAVRTDTDRLCFVREIHRHPVVENAERPLPKSIVAICFTVLHDTAIDLIYLFKTTLLHHGADHFTSNTARTVRHDFFVFDVVILVTLKFIDEVS